MTAELLTYAFALSLFVWVTVLGREIGQRAWRRELRETFIRDRNRSSVAPRSPRIRRCTENLQSAPLGTDAATIPKGGRGPSPAQGRPRSRTPYRGGNCGGLAVPSLDGTFRPIVLHPLNPVRMGEGNFPR